MIAVSMSRSVVTMDVPDTDVQEVGSASPQRPLEDE